MKTTFH